MENCDMCGTKIVDSKCSCGTWKTKEETEDDPIPKAIEKFHLMNLMCITADMPHLGCAVVFFRGDYKDCKMVEEFICKIKGRPYYKSE